MGFGSNEVITDGNSGRAEAIRAALRKLSEAVPTILDALETGNHVRPANVVPLPAVKAAMESTVDVAAVPAPVLADGGNAEDQLSRTVNELAESAETIRGRLNAA